MPSANGWAAANRRALGETSPWSEPSGKRGINEPAGDNAFNPVVNPQFKEGKPTMFICGNDEAAKQIVRGVLDQFGWETADMGTAEAALAIEPLCMLWCIPGFFRNQWSHAFKLLRQE